MKTLGILRRVDKGFAAYVIQPLFVFIILYLSIKLFLYVISNWSFSGNPEFGNPEYWYGTVLGFTLPISGFFLFALSAKYWLVVLFNSKWQERLIPILTVLVKVLFVPFTITFAYLCHGLFVLFNAAL